jgi:hypothetical protein
MKDSNNSLSWLDDFEAEQKKQRYLAIKLPYDGATSCYYTPTMGERLSGIRHKITTFNAKLISPFLAITGMRFTKSWRHEATWFHAFVYNYILDSVTANYSADKFGITKGDY